MIGDEFKSDLNRLINEHKDKNEYSSFKRLYYELVRKYHPDMNEDNKDQCDKCMMILNHIYSNMKKGSKNSMDDAIIDEYEKSKIDGKYQFVNRDNRTERVSDKSLFLYKMGLDRILWSRDYLCSHPMSDGYGDEIISTVSEELYKAIRYLNASLEIGNDKNWKEEAIEKTRWAYEMNSRITKTMYNKEMKGIMIRLTT